MCMSRQQAQDLSNICGMSVPEHTCWESLIHDRHVDFGSAFTPSTLRDSSIHPTRDGLAPKILREQLAKVTLAVYTFELFIPSKIPAIRHYRFGGACSDMA